MSDEQHKLAHSIDDVTALIPGGRDKVYQLIREHKLEARKLGRRTIILDDALRRCLNELPILKLPS